MQPDLDALTARSQRYWNADGLPEVIMGVLWSSTNWLFVGLGAAAAVLGAVRFTRFMKQHPRPTPEQA